VECISDWYKGYGTKDTHPMYRTSNSLYGSQKPSVHTMPTCYHTMSQDFTDVSSTQTVSVCLSVSRSSSDLLSLQNYWNLQICQ